MTDDNEVTREKTFSEELPYFKERMNDAFERYTNSDGHIDVVHISLLIDTKRILRKAEEEINRQQEEVERLEKALNGRDQLVNALNKCYKQAKSEAIKEFVEKLKKCYDNPVWYLGGSNGFFDNLDNFVKEMVGDTE